jgi:hypothetical protein
MACQNIQAMTGLSVGCLSQIYSENLEQRVEQKDLKTGTVWLEKKQVENCERGGCGC